MPYYIAEKSENGRKKKISSEVKEDTGDGETLAKKAVEGDDAR